MTLGQRWTLASIATRAGYVVAIVAALSAVLGVLKGVDAWAGNRVTQIVEREVPGAVERAVGSDIDDISGRIDGLVSRIERLIVDIDDYHDAVSGYRRRVDEMERKLEERLSGVD